MCEHLNLSLKKPTIIHITGTNGKGSVAFKCSRVLSKYGFKAGKLILLIIIGLFTSPHIVDVCERITVDNQKISEDDFLKYYDIVNENLHVLGKFKPEESEK